MNRRDRDTWIAVVCGFVLIVGICALRLFPPQGFKQERSNGDGHNPAQMRVIEIPIPAESEPAL